ncbi:MAG: DMT family transporter, partial [Chloroflexota bacterium]
NRLLGILLGIIGVTILIGADSLGGLSLAGLGQILILVASLFYAISAIYAGRFSHLPPIVSAASMLTASTVMMLPMSLLFDQPWQIQLTWSTVWAVLGSALLSTVLGYIIYYRLRTTTSPTNLMLVTFLIPINAVLWGSTLLGEQISGSMIIGMLVIFSGLIVIDGRILLRLSQHVKGTNV